MSIGKLVHSRVYLHFTAIQDIEPVVAERIERSALLAGVRIGHDFNIIKFDLDSPFISLSSYPDFFDDAFPALAKSWRVNIDTGLVTFRHYNQSTNPPILHRKELLLPPDHPRRAEFAALTASAVALGLFTDTTRIGFKQYWERLITAHGYQVVGHELLPIGNDEGRESDENSDNDESSAAINIARHRTALTRHSLSAPVQCLARYGFLDGSLSFFDYGCGRGDDVRNLRANGLVAAGWDPYFAPTEPLIEVELVNLGFVFNVIEDRHERVEALVNAFRLARRLLVVSAMLMNAQALRGQVFNDGVLTQRSTFQKYYTQAELQVFIRETLDEEPIPVGPGMFFIFKDKDEEQRFLLGRQRNSFAVRRLRTAVPANRERRVKVDRYAVHAPLAESLWRRCLALGRAPESDEIDNLPALLEAFGTLRKALRYTLEQANAEEWEAAQQARRDDLTVYFALGQFARRPAYRHLEPGLQRDIKALFGDYAPAHALARSLLFQVADVDRLALACQAAAEAGLGCLQPGESLQLPTRWVNRLPPLLRVYVGCGTVLYGDVENADLIKIHINSGKLTLLRFDDFVGKPLPKMMERVKIKLRELDFDVFDYGEAYAPPYLYYKSRYISEEFPHFAEQLAFDEGLEGLEAEGIVDLSGYGPKAADFDDVLEATRWHVEGFTLQRSRSMPDLDSPCGAYLTYRQLIECGETQTSTGHSNLPSQPDSYTALLDLARFVIDPVIEYFGMITLTYGFCSRELAKAIPGRIAPKLDQHAAHELNTRKQPICPRLGAAVDFIVPDENMREVADWIIENTPFDRLYFYGEDRPLHVSYGPEQKREFVEMLQGPSGRLVPRVKRFSG
ncbi:MAG: DNA phosphorothioation-associated putative methyltransferase [Methylococcus sp.]